MKNRVILVFVLFLLLNLIPHLYIAFNPADNLLNWYLTDDAFYYFKVAQNISEGFGVTFDGIAPTNGFHPLWMAVCVPVFALARFDLFLPLRVLIIVQAVLNAASGYFLFRLFRDRINSAVAWLAAIFWMFMPVIHGVTTKLGLETGLNVFALIFLFFQTAKFLEKDKEGSAAPLDLFWVGLAAAFALFSRLDNIFVILMLGFWLVFQKSKMRWITQIDFVLILVTVIVAYFLRIQTTDNIFNFLPFLFMLIGFSLVIKPLCLYVLGIYDLNREQKCTQYVLKTFLGLTLASVFIGILFYILHDLLHAFRGISRAVLILDWALGSVLMCAFRWVLYAKLYGRNGTSDTSFKDHWKTWFGRALIFFGPTGVLLTGYMALNKWYAGSTMPVSGQIKRWWGTLPNTVYGRPIKTLTGVLASMTEPNIERGPFWMLIRPIELTARWVAGVFAISADSAASSFLHAIVWIIFIAFVLALLLNCWRQFIAYASKIALLPLLTGSLIHALSYKATGYLHAKYWYWLAEMLLILITTGVLLAASLDQNSQSKYPKKGVAAITFMSSGAVYLFFLLNLINAFPLGSKAPSLYDYEGDFRFLQKHTAAGDVIGMTGGGATAYFMPDRKFVNLDGLINSAEYFSNLKNGTAEKYLASVGLKYVYGEEQVLLDSDPYRWIFTDRLKMIGSTSMFNLYKFCPSYCP